jgi:hypothetical protein
MNYNSSRKKKRFFPPSSQTYPVNNKSCPPPSVASFRFGNNNNKEIIYFHCFCGIPHAVDDKVWNEDGKKKHEKLWRVFQQTNNMPLSKTIEIGPRIFQLQNIGPSQDIQIVVPSQKQLTNATPTPASATAPVIPTPIAASYQISKASTSSDPYLHPTMAIHSSMKDTFSQLYLEVFRKAFAQGIDIHTIRKLAVIADREVNSISDVLENYIRTHHPTTESKKTQLLIEEKRSLVAQSVKNEDVLQKIQDMNAQIQKQQAHEKNAGGKLTTLETGESVLATSPLGCAAFIEKIQAKAESLLQNTGIFHQFRLQNGDEAATAWKKQIQAKLKAAALEEIGGQC